MAILDVFKKNKPSSAKATEGKGRKTETKEEKSIVEKPIKKERAVKTPKAVKTEKPAEKPVRKTREKRVIDSYEILKAPHITEKATDLVDKNQYAFNVFPRTNKKEIKRAVESVFGVDVIKVNIINIPAKKRRLGRTSGFRKGFKKAIVKIKEGQKIEVLPK